MKAKTGIAFRVIFLFLFVSIISQSGFAQWTAVASGDWDNAATWSPATVPDGTAGVTIPNTFTVDYSAGNLSYGNTITIDAGGVLTVSAGDFNQASTVDVSGTLSTSGNMNATGGANFTINSGGQVDAGGSFASNVTLTVDGVLNVATTYTVSGSTFTVGATGTIDVTGSISITGGSSHSVASGGSFLVGTTATLNTDLTVDGTMSVAGNASFNAFIIGATGDVTIGGTFTTSSNLTINGDLDISSTMTINGGTYSQGSASNLTIGGSLSSNTTLAFDGYTNISGNLSATSFSVASGATLIVGGNVSSNGTVGISGDFLVAGDQNLTGGTVTVASGGVWVVGGDVDKGGNNIVVDAGGYGSVLGDLTSTGGSTTVNGEMVVIGVDSGTGSCTTCDVILDDDDPIWAVLEGIRSIYWEDFTGETGNTVKLDDGFSNWEILDTEIGAISGADEGLVATFTNNRPRSYSIWETEGVTIGCYTDMVVSAYITGTLKDNINFEYSLYIGGSWQNWNNVGEVDATNGLRRTSISTTATMIRLRMNAVYIEGPGSITLDNISISGTLGFGPELPAIELDANYAEMAVCTGQTGVYRLTEEFASYTWSVSDPGSNTLTNGSTSSPTIVWNTVPATLSVSVTSECGRTGSQSWEITNDNSFKLVLLDNSDPSCFGDADGSITVGAYCGSANLQYSIDTDPVQTNTTGIFTNLEGTTYTITAEDLDNSYTDVLVFELVPPTEIHIDLLPTSSTFSCNGDFGCSGILDFNIWGGEGLLVPTLSGVADDNPSVTLQIDPLIELVISSDYTISGYPLIVTVDKASFPEVYPDFSDVRFFADADLTVPLYYWMDPAFYNYDDEATFYVKTDVADGSSIYMYYGDATAYPATSSITEVLTQGGMALEYYTQTGWNGTATACIDNSSSLEYDRNSIFSDCNLQLVDQNQSFKWKGWYNFPSLTLNAQPVEYLKLDYGDGGALQFYIGSDELAFGNKYVDVSAYRGTTQYIELWYSKPSGLHQNDRYIEAAFSQTNGTVGPQDVMLDPSSCMSRYSVDPEPIVTPVLSARYTGLCAGTYNLTVTDGGTGCSVTTEDILIEVDDDAVTFETSSLPGDYSDDQLNHATTVDGQTLYYNNFSSPVASYTTTGSFTSEMYKIKHAGNGTGTLTIETSTKGFTSIDISFIAYQSVGGDPGWASTDYLQIAYEYDDGTGTWVNDGDVPVLDDTGIWSGEDGIPGTQFPNNGNSVGSEFTYTFADGHGIEDKDNIRIIITVYSGSTDRNYYFDEITITGATDYSVDPTVSGEPTVLEAGVPGTIEPYYIDQVVANATCGGSILITRTWNAVDNCGTYATPYVQNITLYDNSVGPSLVLGAANEPSTNYSFCENEVTLTVPVAGANICEDYTVYYKIDGGTAVDVYTGDLASQPTTSTITYTFPVGTTTTFTWGVIDPVLATFEQDYSVTVSDELDATFTYNPDPPGFCVGGSATVTATPSGGIGPYTYVFATVDDRITGTAGSGASGQWTSDQFADGDQVKVEITDSRGCDTNDNTVPGDIADSQAFTVYPNVVTPAISN